MLIPLSNGVEIMGFCVPIEHWLQGSLCDWAEALLDEKRLQEKGCFDSSPTRKCGRSMSVADVAGIIIYGMC